MRILDLFCGAGGSAMGYKRAFPDAEIVGIDKVVQPNYPFPFVRMDALDAGPFLDTYDLVHASPPCQTFTAYKRRGCGVGDGYLNLIPETRAMLQAAHVPYVIENVPGSDLDDHVQLCGSSFGLDVRRHRWFESNMPLRGSLCDHHWQTPRFPPATNRTNLRSTVEVGVYRIPLATQKQAMGVDWPCTLHELSEMVPPAYTHHIGRQFAAVSCHHKEKQTR